MTYEIWSISIINVNEYLRSGFDTNLINISQVSHWSPRSGVKSQARGMCSGISQSFMICMQADGQIPIPPLKEASYIRTTGSECWAFVHPGGNRVARSNLHRSCQLWSLHYWTKITRSENKNWKCGYLTRPISQGLKIFKIRRSYS